MDFSSGVLDATRSRLLARLGVRVVGPWWARLPSVLAELTARWELTLGDPVGRGACSLVLRAWHLDGRPAMLKLTPDLARCRREAAALLGWEASGRVPRIYACDVPAGALLLEAILGETPLPQSRIRTGLAEISELIGTLHHSGPASGLNGAVSLADKVESIFSNYIGQYGSYPVAARAVPLARLERGRELARSLAARCSSPVLLHGDLSPDNVIDGGSGRGLVAIDPSPCIGDGAFDAVEWVLRSASDRLGWEASSLSLSSLLGVDQQRLLGWCAAFAAMLAGSKAERGAPSDEIQALLELIP